MELTISEIDEQFSNYISDRNNIVKNNGRVNRKYVPLILEPVFTISLDAFKKGYPVALIYKILLQQNKIPGEIRLPTFKAWFFKQRKKRNNDQPRQEISNNVVRIHNKVNNINRDSDTLEKKADNNSFVQENSSFNKHQIISDPVIQDEIKTNVNVKNDATILPEEDENILFATYYNDLQNTDKWKLSSNEETWLKVYERLLEQKKSFEFINQYLILKHEEEIPILESTKERDYIYIPNRLISLSPLNPKYPFMFPVNWLCYDENGIIYEQKSQLPIPYEYTITIQCKSILQQPENAIVPKDPKEFGKGGIYLGGYKLNSYFKDYFTSNKGNNYPKVHRLLES